MLRKRRILCGYGCNTFGPQAQRVASLLAVCCVLARDMLRLDVENDRVNYAIGFRLKKNGNPVQSKEV